MTFPRSVALLTIFALANLSLTGCGRVEISLDRPPELIVTATRYPVRTDLMAVADLGAPPKWFTPGYTPLRTAQLGDRSPDADFVTLLRPKVARLLPEPKAGAILDPETGLTASERDDIGQLLDQYFGTPSDPALRVLSDEDGKRLKLDEAIAPVKGTTPQQAIKRLLTEAGEAKVALGLNDTSLARGGVLYRRWCLQCHGSTGAGDGAQTVQRSAPPRDYRRGLFKFVTCYPTSIPRAGELGKARKDDLKRTVRNGLEGSMMPPFNQLTEEELDDLTSYVIHLSARGEAEFDMIARVIGLKVNPRDDDPAYSREFVEQRLVEKLLLTLGNWKRANDSPIPIPPENCPTQTERLESQVRGFKAFTGTCAACHQDYGRSEQLKFDLWGTVVQPRNLTLGVYRGGRRGEDLYARIYGGIYPSTMPDSKAKAISPEPRKPDEIWDLVHFLQALADAREKKQLQQYDPTIKIDP